MQVNCLLLWMVPLIDATIVLYVQHAGKYIWSHNIATLYGITSMQQCYTGCVDAGATRSMDFYWKEQMCICQAVSYEDVPLANGTDVDHYGMKAKMTNGQLHVATMRQGQSIAEFEMVSSLADTVLLVSIEASGKKEVSSIQKCGLLCLAEEACEAFILQEMPQQINMLDCTLVYGLLEWF